MALLKPYKGYRAKVDFDEEDCLIFGELLGIADTICFHAEKPEDVVNTFHQCVDDYLKHCVEIGKEPDKAYRGCFNVRITPELHKEADLRAAVHGISLNQFVINAIQHEVQRSTSKSPAAKR